MAAAIVMVVAIVISAGDDSADVEATGPSDGLEAPGPTQPADEFEVEFFDVDHVGEAIDDGEFGWVASPEGVMTKLDIETGTTLDEFTIPEFVGTGWLASGFDSVWFADPAEGQLHRFRTDTGGVDSISIPGALWVAAGDDAVWVTSVTEGALYRVDPDTNAVAARIDLSPSTNSFIVNTNDASMYVTSSKGGRGTLRRVDPTTNSVTAAVDVGRPDMGAGPQGVWIPNSNAGAVEHRDPQTLAVLAEVIIPVRDDSSADLGGLHEGGGFLWQKYLDTNSDGEVVTAIAQIDPTTDLVVASVHLRAGEDFAAINGGPSAVWFTINQTGQIGRILLD
ncbi:MAG TPA: hypothetical protein VMW08_16200 [Acidimicrobiales bacterium]|nr:hypothetical protein [Acidimicrobiales bacterium]